MTTPPPSSIPHRSPRAQLATATPAVFRLPDGRSSRGELQVISVTGGLVSLPKPMDHGSRVMLMFLSPTGTVLGSAEMLKPISWALQPFRFLSLDEANRTRLKGVVRASLAQQQPEYDWVSSYRAKLAHGNPPKKGSSRMILAALTLATACLGSAILYSAFLR
jgi:hypothetical protein